MRSEDPPFAGKEAFHRKYSRILRAVARKLGLQPSEYSVRSNKGGPAVLGEVILHANHLYVSVGGSLVTAEQMEQPDTQFMYRSCRGQKDYTGGANQWAAMRVFQGEQEQAVEIFRGVIDRAKAAPLG